MNSFVFVFFSTQKNRPRDTPGIISITASVAYEPVLGGDRVFDVGLSIDSFFFPIVVVCCVEGDFDGVDYRATTLYSTFDADVQIQVQFTKYRLGKYLRYHGGYGI